MATNAIRLLTQQHRDIEKWFEQLAGLRSGAAAPIGGTAGTWPHEGWSQRGTTDSTEEIRESAEAGLRIAGPEAVEPQTSPRAGIPPHSELARTATPVPSEGDGYGDDAIPGQEYRDLAGHYADGKTHVGVSDDQVRAQMYDAESGKPRPESMLGQGRETLSGVRDQFGQPEMAAPARGKPPGAGQKAATGGPREAHASKPEDGRRADPTLGLVPSGSPPPWQQATPDPYEVALSEQDLDHKRALSARLFDALVAHSVLEEQLLYPAARAIAADLVEASLEAHREMRDTLDELRHTDPALARFDHLIGQLQHVFQEHVREEEVHLFPRLHEELGAARLEEMGMHMQERFRVLIGLERRFSVHGLEGVAVLQPPAVALGHLEEVDALAGSGPEGGPERHD